jgi:hypothetical protein
MKKTLKHVLTMVLPLAGLSALIGACASTPCNNDSCYSRRISSVDPYKEGEIAAWGTEKEQAEQDEKKDRKVHSLRFDGAGSQ